MNGAWGLMAARRSSTPSSRPTGFFERMLRSMIQAIPKEASLAELFYWELRINGNRQPQHLQFPANSRNIWKSILRVQKRSGWLRLRESMELSVTGSTGWTPESRSSTCSRSFARPAFIPGNVDLQQILLPSLFEKVTRNIEWENDCRNASDRGDSHESAIRFGVAIVLLC